MDKAEKKRLKKLYKEQELKKMIEASPDNLVGDVLKNYAKRKLGVKSEPLDLQKLENTKDEDLIELISQKIENYSSWMYHNNPRLYKSHESYIFLSTNYLKVVYFYSQLKEFYELEDHEDYLTNLISKEKNALLECLTFVGAFELKTLIEVGEIEKATSLFAKIEPRLSMTIQKLIRDNLKEFIIE